MLCLLDSVTRFAMALREIYLAAGAAADDQGLPAGRLRRAPAPAGARRARCRRTGSITGLFTVLVEGDDTNEPVADTVRGILDGHVLLDRRIAEAGRFPAVDVLRSVSRTAPGCYAPDERPLVREARRLMAAHAEMAELIQVGAYRQGASVLIDRAIAVRPALEALLAQAPDDPPDYAGALRPFGPDPGHGRGGPGMRSGPLVLLARLERQELDRRRQDLAARERELAAAWAELEALEAAPLPSWRWPGRCPTAPGSPPPTSGACPVAPGGAAGAPARASGGGATRPWPASAGSGGEAEAHVPARRAGGGAGADRAGTHAETLDLDERATARHRREGGPAGLRTRVPASP